MPVTMLDELRARIGDVRSQKRDFHPLVHIGLFSVDGQGDPEQLNCKEIILVGEDFIEVGGRLIDRRDIREVHPINF